MANNIKFDNFELNIYNRHLESLEGIDRFKNLRKLRVFNSKIASLKFSGCTGLKFLQISNSRVFSLRDMGCFNSLESLILDNNPLQSLEGIEVLKTLEFLHLVVNNGEGIKFYEPVCQLENLKTIISEYEIKDAKRFITLVKRLNFLENL